MRRFFSILTLITLLFCAHFAAAESATVQKIIDGDTVWAWANSRTVKVRLLCIDTLEKKYNEKLVKDAKRLRESTSSMIQGGQAATQHLRELIHIGDKIRLEYGPNKYDQYGRTLAYVYSPQGTNINLQLVKDGYAGVLCYAPNDAKAEEFMTALHEAKAARRGLWGKGLILQERWVKGH